MSKARKRLTSALVNPDVLKFKYDVRGAIVNRAYQLQQQLAQRPDAFPFKKVYMCNVGNPQSLGQAPVTYLRQILSACLNPALLAANVLPADVVAKAKQILGPGGSIGEYTHSQGDENIRRSVARRLSLRDGVPSDHNDIFLTNGATQGIKTILQMLISTKLDAIMVPVPQYPLYSASIQLFGGKMVGYYLDEEKDWAVDMADIGRQFRAAKENGANVRALCVINPGNPTGQVLSRRNIEDIIAFAFAHDVVLLADEVYQDNVYDPARPFVSFRKVLSEMGPSFSTQELFSFDSVSKGVLGECGVRGGYAELLNVDPSIHALWLKMASASLCPNIAGQVAVAVLADPPRPGAESFARWDAETRAIFASLQRRAAKTSAALSAIAGVECRPIAGAMYAFPRLAIPRAAAEAAAAQGVAPDAFYCLALLETEGICAVPGSGFAQKDGTYHLRITILPPEEELDHVVARFGEFQKAFVRKYGGE